MSSQKAMELEQKYGSFNYTPLPFVFSRGEGIYLWDPEGKRYMDFVSGFSAVSQGHCHPRIVKAIQEQAAKLTLLSRVLYSDQFGPFAEYATKLFGYDRILTMNTGAEAFETSLKLVRKWAYTVKKVPAGQAKIIVCRENFHGRTIAAASAASKEEAHQIFGPVVPGFVHIPFDDLTALEEALRDPNVAAFLVEPIQGEGGVVVPQDGYLKKAFALCEKHNALMVADEVQTGIARTGKLLACQHEGVKPHITTLGKALSGGTIPVSAVLADETLMKVLQPGDHGSTFGGSPFACHVALESLKVIVDEKLAEKAEKLGQIFRAALRDLGSPWIKEVRGKGLLNAVVFDFGGDAAKDQALSLALKENGLVVKAARTGVFRFAPPLVITEQELKDAVGIIGKTLAAWRS
ncbi:MAG TPA: ornithine--oxo-acid transaminase [Bdellovibrionota bacterium]